MDLSKINLHRLFPYIILASGLVGSFASLVLSYDTLQISRSANYTPACNLNPVISCGSVINATGDTIFGIPYPYYGLLAFGALTTIGASILAGARFKRWYWQSFQAATTLGLIGAYLLLIKSVFNIHALCPYCLSVDVVTTTLFWYLTLYNIDTGQIKLHHTWAQNFYRKVRLHHLDILIIWFLIVAALVLKHFWYYYGKYF